MEKLEFIIALLSALSAVLALAVKLWKTFATLINEKKYSRLFDYIAEAVIYAEELSGLSGDEKKDRAMELIQNAADQLNIQNFDSERISIVIDTIIDVSKKVNAKN